MHLALLASWFLNHQEGRAVHCVPHAIITCIDYYFSDNPENYRNSVAIVPTPSQ